MIKVYILSLAYGTISWYQEFGLSFWRNQPTSNLEVKIMRPNLSLKSEKLLKKIMDNGMTDYGSNVDVIHKALELLWNHEKTLAYKDLGQKLTAHYEQNPEEQLEMARVQGVVGYAAGEFVPSPVSDDRDWLDEIEEDVDIV
jgi:hypothetical protein